MGGRKEMNMQDLNLTNNNCSNNDPGMNNSYNNYVGNPQNSAMHNNKYFVPNVPTNDFQNTNPTIASYNGQIQAPGKLLHQQHPRSSQHQPMYKINDSAPNLDQSMYAQMAGNNANNNMMMPNSVQMAYQGQNENLAWQNQTPNVVPMTMRQQQFLQQQQQQQQQQELRSLQEQQQHHQFTNDINPNIVPRNRVNYNNMGMVNSGVNSRDMGHGMSNMYPMSNMQQQQQQQQTPQHLPNDNMNFNSDRMCEVLPQQQQQQQQSPMYSNPINSNIPPSGHSFTNQQSASLIGTPTPSGSNSSTNQMNNMQHPHANKYHISSSNNAQASNQMHLIPQQTCQGQTFKSYNYVADPKDENFKLYQQQLMLILHTQHCEQNRQAFSQSSQHYTCNVNYCAAMKQVLNHAINCVMDTCPVEHCKTSKDILQHWQMCNISHCALCVPIKMKLNEGNSGAFGKSSNNPNNKILQIVNMNQYHNNITINKMPVNNTRIYNNDGSVNLAQNSNYGEMQQNTYSDSNQANPEFKNLPSSLNTPGQIPITNSFIHNSSTNVLTSNSNESIDDKLLKLSQSTHDWKSKLNNEARQGIILGLVAAINPYKDISVIQEESKNSLMIYARQTEKSAFKNSKSLSEYIHILITKIVSIHHGYFKGRLEENQSIEDNCHSANSSIKSSHTLSSVSNTNSPVKMVSTSKKTEIDETVIPHETKNIDKGMAKKNFETDLDESNNRKMTKDQIILEKKSGENHLPENSMNTLNDSNVSNNSMILAREFESSELLNAFSKNLKDLLLQLKTDVSDNLMIMVGFNHKSDSHKNDSSTINGNLSTIERKISDNIYKNPMQVNNHIHLIIESQISNHRKSNKISKILASIKLGYDIESQSIMSKYGYCCSKLLYYKPQDMSCQAKSLCFIKVNQEYYIYDKYPYCIECFDNIKESYVEVVENIAKPAIKIEKTQFARLCNNVNKLEPIVVCKMCRLHSHISCVNYVHWMYPKGFVCPNCITNSQLASSELVISNRFTARALPSSQLGNFIENHVNSYLQQNDYKDSLVKHDPQKANNLGRIIVRVVYDDCKKFSWQTNFASWSGPFKSSSALSRTKGNENEGTRSSHDDSVRQKQAFPYRTRSIHVFQELKQQGLDICLFAMIVHEYGSDCPEPNRNRAYISYIDSVKYFEPCEFRTRMYHQILVAYLLYCKNNNFNYVHIWSCPPGENDDYIYFRHPAEQKVPKVKMLCEWYQNMIKSAYEVQALHSHCNLAQYLKQNNVDDVRDIPYFDGDFWPNMIENSILELQENQNKQASSAKEIEVFDIDGGNSKNKTSKSKKYKSQKPKRIAKNNKKLSASSSGNLFDCTMNLIEKYKDIFFVISLNEQKKTDIVVNNDFTINCELMDGRDNFLTFARENNFEFSNRQRAVHSTLNFLYELHHQISDLFNCNVCNELISTASYYNCPTCEDFDMCMRCKESSGVGRHEHEMNLVANAVVTSGSIDSSDLVARGGVRGIDSNASSTSTKLIHHGNRGSILAALQKKQKGNCITPPCHSPATRQHNLKANDLNVYERVLLHAVECVDGNCTSFAGGCVSIKKILLHYKSCRGGGGVCVMCRFTNALLLHHSKMCQRNKSAAMVAGCSSSSSGLQVLQGDKCAVPKCHMIAERLRMQQKKREDQERAFLRSRISISIQQTCDKILSPPTHNNDDQHDNNEPDDSSKDCENLPPTLVDSEIA